MLTSPDTDTICAIATPPGRSGVGIIRISGPHTRRLASLILHFEPTPRHAHYCSFFDNDSGEIDQGIALFSLAPTHLPAKMYLSFKAMAAILYSIIYSIV